MGKGTVFAQLSWSYFIKTDSADAAFACTVKEAKDKDGSTTKSDLTARICCRHARRGASGMAVLELEALSGYEFDTDEVDRLTDVPDLQRAELAKGDTQANVYFQVRTYL